MAVPAVGPAGAAHRTAGTSQNFWVPCESTGPKNQEKQPTPNRKNENTNTSDHLEQHLCGCPASSEGRRPSASAPDRSHTRASPRASKKPGIMQGDVRGNDEGQEGEEDDVRDDGEGPRG